MENLKKGTFLWKVPLIEKGDPIKIAELLKSAGMTRLDVKVAEGNAMYKVPIWNHATWGQNVKRDWVRAIQGAGIKVFGYGFAYGYDAVGEGMIAARAVNELKLDGWIVNAEGRFESWSDSGNRALIYVRRFRDNSPHVPALACTWPLWRNPWTGSYWHKEDMAKVFMDDFEYGMPMIYWWNNRAILWLEKAVEQWRNLVTDKPLIPVGRAYSGEGLGTLQLHEVQAFGDRVREMPEDVLGESWWVLRLALARPEVWDIIKKLPTWADPPPPPTAPIDEVVRELTTWARTKGYEGPDLENG
jgi:hypothetical protein